ncbi:MAG: sensor domain-containing diguanylate cyclase [Candidatus Eremiobacteraeota bacterium]|nr:sensor domain-containing diguanylate cyclase [Candidatus Eremiobacteraeota bacterium]MCW5872688.1 sensor domain-containing diguanylate cyclase [Candidatus Eremiobacteraeota bacterium]
MPPQVETHLELLLEPTLLDGLNQSFANLGVGWVVRQMDGQLYSPWPTHIAGQEWLAQIPLLSGSHRWAEGEAVQKLVEIAAGPLAWVCELRNSQSSAPSLIDHAADLLKRESSLRYELQSTLEELISKYEELTVVYDSAETIVSITDLDGMAQRILDEAADLLDVDHASLMLVEKDRLVVKAARGARKDLVNSSLPLDADQISGHVAREGKPVLVEDLATDSTFGRGSREEDAARSLCSVPLQVRGSVLGVLNVNHKRSGDPFNSGDLKLLMALGSLAAISIQNARTYQNAITDRLTNLYNYGYFREQLERFLETARQEESTVSMIMFDIDHFKNFNDVNGHDLANVALVGVASLCVANSRQQGDRMPDLVARYGGEEFMILLQGISKTDAYLTAERIRKQVESTHYEGGQNQPMGKLTISMGVANFPEDAENSEALIKQADQALYKAKRAGRNNVQLAG